jgi:DNA-binding transcriptional ArsR family regulator
VKSTANRRTPEAVFKALGNPARLALVRTLQGGERCVCDLVAAAGLGWSTTSKHLEILRDAGIVASDKRGQKVFYQLRLGCVAEFISCLEATAPARSARRTTCDRT